VPTPVLDPPLLFLADCRVGRPVAFPLHAAMTQAITHAVGRNVHPFVAECGLPAATGLTLRWAYVRSPAAVAVIVTIELNQALAVGSLCTVTATLTAPPLVVGDGTQTAPDLVGTDTSVTLDGSIALECPTSADRAPPPYERTFDVTSFDHDTVYDLTVSTATSTGSPLGVFRVTATEVTRSALAPEFAP
jgi:hypothetical protein